MNKKIPITSVITRNNILRYKTESQKPNPLYATYKEKYNFYNLSTSLKEWVALSTDLNEAAERAMDIYEVVEEHGTDRQIEIAGSIISERVMPVLKDAQALQRRIKRRLGSLKTKIKTKTMNKIEAIKGHTEETSIACLNRMLDVIDENAQCDRVINNHANLSKRFNVDMYISTNGILKENVNECIYALCEMIDTYNSSDSAKYCCALENILYAFNKNHIKIDESTVVRCVTDYFLLSRMDSEATIQREYVENLHDVIVKNRFMRNSDNYGIDFDKQPDSNSGVGYSVLANGIISDDLNYIREGTIQSMVDAFRSKVDKNPSNLKELIRKVFTKPASDIVDEVPNLLNLIFAFVIVAAAISMAVILGILVFLTVCICHMTMQRSENKRIIKAYESHIKKVKDKIEKENDQKKADRLKQYCTSLEKELQKIKDYSDSMLGDDEEKSYEKDNNDDLDIDTDFNFENFVGFGKKNNESIYQLAVIEDAVNSIRWDENKVVSIIREGINNLPLKDIDTITNFSVSHPEFLHPSNLIYTYENHLENLRANKRVGRYIAIDCLKENIDKLKKFDKEMIIEESSLASIYENMVSTYAIQDYLENYDFTKELPLVEMSFSSTLDLAIDKVKKVAQDLSDNEKIMSRTIDSSLETLKRSTEKAMTQENREAVIKGDILPPASKIIKLAITTGFLWIVNPALAVIALIGTIGCNANTRMKERQLLLDELDVELQMVERYIKTAEEKNDMKGLRELLMIQKKLQAQEARLRYKMTIENNDAVKDSTKDRDKD